MDAGCWMLDAGCPGCWMPWMLDDDTVDEIAK